MSRIQGQFNPAHKDTADDSAPPHAQTHAMGPSPPHDTNPSRIASLTNSLFAAFKARGKLLRPGTQEVN